MYKKLISSWPKTSFPHVFSGNPCPKTSEKLDSGQKNAGMTLKYPVSGQTLIKAVCVITLLITWNSFALHFVAYGDSRTNASIHQDIVDAFAKENPELVLHSGDLWDDYSPAQWKDHLQKNSNIAQLLEDNKFLVARGNHESLTEVLAFRPPIVRNNSERYSFTEGNCFFVSMGMNPGSNTSWLETQLQSPESQNADWRFVFAHYPVYSASKHGASGKSSFETLCDQYKVIMFFSGHDHDYERTHLIYNQKTVSENTEINIEETPGTFYCVVGGGGAPLYSAGSKWWTAISEKTYHYSVIDATPEKLEFVVKDRSGSMLDKVTITKEVNPFSLVQIPNGGEKWEQNNTYTITWQDNINEMVKIELYKGTTLASIITEYTESSGEFDWTVLPNLKPGSDYSIKIFSTDDPAVTDESDNYFTIEEEFIVAQFPYVQTFDDMDTGAGRALSENWEQLGGDDFDWIVWTGPTPSKIGGTPDVTGPDNDHTSGTGNYIYIEASDPNSPSKKADIISPKFDTRQLINAELTFWCHMFSDSNHMGDLYLDVNVDGTWETDILHLTDNQGDTWFSETVNLAQYTGERVRFRFRGVTGQSWAGDICIDDFRIIETGVDISTLTTAGVTAYDILWNGSKLFFQIPHAQGKNRERVRIALFDLKGRHLYTLLNTTITSGKHVLRVNSTQCASGLYLCRLQAKDWNKTITVMIGK